MTLLALFPSTSYALAYALPLFFLSLPVTFAGAFLTLDRTRTFAPRADAGYQITIPGSLQLKAKRRVLRIPLQGGLGGLLGGYLVGMHVSTFLTLLIPGVTTSAALSPKSFIPVWLLSAIITTILGARWRYAALPFYGIAGGATLALSLCVIVHPTLLTRIVFISILAPLLTLFTLLPIERTRHVALRVAAASTGAFGIVTAIAILGKVPAWADAWERLWIKDGIEWGTTKEKGLSAAFCLLFSLGVACDWFLRRRFGENPDQEWDSYLANYAVNLPNASDRAGVFQPLTSPFTNIFHKGHPRNSVPLSSASFDPESTLFSEDIKDMPPPPPYPVKLQKYRSQSKAQTSSPDLFEYTLGAPKRPGFLKKKSTALSVPRAEGKRGREAVKFRPLADNELSSEDEDGEGPAGARPWLRSQTSFAASSTSGATLTVGTPDKAKEVDALDVEKERAAISIRNGDLSAPDYSDSEEDLATVPLARRASRDAPGWSPDFLRRHKSRATSGGLTTPGGSDHGSGLTTVPTTLLRAVPATPSLIRAIERVNAAQDAAYGFPPIGAPAPEGNIVQTDAHVHAEDEQQSGERWVSFWRDVKQKAAHS